MNDCNSNPFYDLFLDRKLCCNICDKFLTIPPINVVEGIGNVCGRCKPKAQQKAKDDNKLKPQIILETLLKNCSVPCTNFQYGCNASLKFNEEVQIHETVCTFKKEFCPLYHQGLFESACNWSGKSSEYVRHIEKDHAAYIKTPLEVNCERTGRNAVHFTRIGTKLVTIFMKNASDTLHYCLAMMHGSEDYSKCYNYNVHLYDPDRKFTISLSKNKVECLQNFTKYYNSDEKMVAIDLNNFKSVLAGADVLNETLKLKFEIVRKPKDEVPMALDNYYQMEVTEPNIAADQHLLSELTCPKCKNFMCDQTKIYVNIEGQSICGHCTTDPVSLTQGATPPVRNAFGSPTGSLFNARPIISPSVAPIPLGAKLTVVSGPSTIASLNSQNSKMRNYTLERLSMKINRPCINLLQGCHFVANSADLKQHESICALKNVNCIVEFCKKIGTQSVLMSHFLNEHNLSICKTNDSYTLFLNDKRYTCYYQFDDNIFQLTVDEDQQKNLTFNLSYWMHQAGLKKYNYVLQLFNPKRREIFLSCPSVCESMMADEHSSRRNKISVQGLKVNQFFVFNEMINIKFKVKIFHAVD